VDFFAGEADVGGGSSVPDWNGGIPAALSTDNFATFLRGVVFVGEAALRQRLDLKRVGLRAKRGTDPRGPYSPSAPGD
jgi:hypothetical protein